MWRRWSIIYKIIFAAERGRDRFDLTIDPQRFAYDRKYREEVTRQIRDCGFRLNLRPKDQRQFLDKVSPFTSADDPQVNGVLFRAVRAYEVDISSVVPSIAVDANISVMLPDTESEYVIDYSRMAFVQKTTNVGFADGMMQDFSQTVPSPINGFLQIPKAILQAILPVPSSKTGGGSSATSSSSTL